ncbi:Pvc16 family protein [Reichenbachiella sp.]|uniref:Pvc16 family protein n=1 Tax=Reichenbachiella sp. TaxID=2184521 RepID=UPI003BAF4CBB
MIEQSLLFTRNFLDQFLRNRFDLSDSIVQINNLTDPHGNVPEANQNKIIISLINIEQETNQPYYFKKQKLSNGQYADLTPSDRFNIYLLVSSQFDDYQETLKFLNASILFFQINQIIDSSSGTNLPEGIHKLDFDLEQLDYSQTHNLWSAMGAKYTPSVVYKMRLIEIFANQMTGVTTSISESQIDTKP